MSLRALRFPYPPLLAAAGYPDAGQLAHRCQVSRRTVERWKIAGLTWYQADHAAIYIGAHPAAVWPNWCSALSEYDPPE